MTKLGKLWTDSTAYLALILGAGLSIAGNVADTYRTRGQDTDVLDIVMAVAWPALVVLMVEIFVSTRWAGLSWPMQTLRWAGTLAIGGMAMLVSWVHLNDLMATRGQVEIVSTCGPLAIDLLAIMATALILAGRRTGQVIDLDATVAKWTGSTITTDVLPDGTVVDIADGRIVGVGRTVAPVDYSPVTEATDYLARLAACTDSTTTPAHPVDSTPAPPARRTKAVAKPVMDADEALTLARIGYVDSDYTLEEISDLLGGHYGVSGRTIRRQAWWPAVSARPFSVAPNGGE